MLNVYTFNTSKYSFLRSFLGLNFYEEVARGARSSLLYRFLSFIRAVLVRTFVGVTGV